jgi:diaminopimelate epimerase
MRTFAVTKAQGTGNDFIVLENPSGDRVPYAALARKWCRRGHDIGADGLLILETPTAPRADFAMRIFNADGSEAEMCGNGLRCIALYLALNRASLPTALTAQTKAGLVTMRIVVGDGKAAMAGDGATAVAVDMGVPRLLRREIPMRGDPDDRALDAAVETASGSKRLSALSMGNPHCVTFVDEPPEKIDLAAHAAALERLDLFPQGSNYELARVENGALSLRVFERGVGETNACGSGACAAAVAAIATGRAESPVEVRMRGGDLTIEWPSPTAKVIMTGSAEIVFRGEVALGDDEFMAMLAADGM